MSNVATPKVPAKFPGYRVPPAGTQPDYLYEPYVSTIKRSPRQPVIPLPHTLTEVTGPQFTQDDISCSSDDLTLGPAGEAQGQRIIVSGRVLDDGGKPVPRTLVEVWQANSAGRYFHDIDRHGAPLDPNFRGVGHVLTDEQGRYRFATIKPGCYPWRNHYNAWRPAHIHFSVFGPAFSTRIVTQMYFPGDPLLPLDPIFNCVPDEKAKMRLISKFDIESTIPDHALSFLFDIVLRGREETPREASHK